MNARFATLVVALLSLGLTGCSCGQRNMFRQQGAPCGPACSPAAAPSYDMAPSYGSQGGCNDCASNDCGCCNSGDSYAGYNGGGSYNGAEYYDGMSAGGVYDQGGYGSGWQPSNQGPLPGQVMPDGSFVPGPETQMAPMPQPVPQA